jgi:hypothetical protein
MDQINKDRFIEIKDIEKFYFKEVVPDQIVTKLKIYIQ